MKEGRERMNGRERMHQVASNSGWMTGGLLVADALAVFFAGALAIWLRVAIMGQAINFSLYIYWLVSFTILILAAFAWVGLYPGSGVGPVEELRRVVLSISAIMLSLIAYSYLTYQGQVYSRLVLVLMWLFSISFVLAGRALTRKVLIRLGLWGEPLIVFGWGKEGRKLVTYLLNRPEYGLRPLLAVHDGERHTEPIELAPAIPVQRFQDWAKQPGSIRTAIMIIEEIARPLQRQIMDERKFGFKRVILISSMGWVGSKGIIVHDMGGLLGLEVPKNLSNPLYQALKRAIDLGLVILSAPVSIPLLGLLTLLVRLDSPGNAFYAQERVGRDGKRIKIWKIRTMVQHADRALEDMLEKNPDLKDEYNRFRKIKNDPRTTRLGRLIRKTSIDELPQLWNVLKGEMSLVGPRAYMVEEVPLMKEERDLILSVRPGITGMWQVNGRSKLSMEERVLLESYYVRNWSIWMDIHILLKTIWVVLSMDGAY